MDILITINDQRMTIHTPKSKVEAIEIFPLPRMLKCVKACGELFIIWAFFPIP